MKAYYFPKGNGELCTESLYVPKEVVIIKVGENCGADCTPAGLDIMKQFIIDNRRKLKRQGLMRRIEVSEDLVENIKFQVDRREFHFVNIVARQLLQSARVYRGGE